MHPVGINEPSNILSRLTSKALTKRAAQRRPTYIAQGLSFVMDAVILLLYWKAGTTTVATPIIYLACGLTVTSLALLLSELNFNDRFKDHYLTVPQSLSSTTILLGAIYFAPEVGFYFVCINFIVLGFGSLRMSASQTGLVWTYSTFGLTILFLLSERPIAMPMSTWAERALALVCFVTALGRCASTGLYGSSLREALYRSGSDLKRAYARIEELAELDELTGALNRRSIMKVLEEQVTASRRGGQPCSIAMIDLDLFKTINDRFGHPVGDEVLRSFGIALFASIREIDKLGRYGGEEFLLILPDAGPEEALRTIQRLRSLIADLDWLAISPDLTVTMSAGVATINADDTTDTILSRADRALYQAKNAGRNRAIAA
jgi:diguanylate cyclase (GGDEF)-like protein